MYYPYFILYMLIGIVISLGVFFWALKHGQFNDQERARFLALGDDRHGTVKKESVFGRYEIYALWLVALVGLGITGAILVRAVLVAV